MCVCVCIYICVCVCVSVCTQDGYLTKEFLLENQNNS